MSYFPTIDLSSVSSTALTLGQKTKAAALPVVLSSDEGLEQSAFSPGTVSAPAAALLVGGKTNDGTPQYQPIPLTAAGAAVKVDASGSTQPISGTVTVQQSTAANLKVDLSGTAANATAIKTDGSAVTQPVSAASLPLPSGASTAAKQPALGTAGSASSDVLTVQGIASMTALKVDGSAVTQPVSGTVTANQGTANATPWNTSLAAETTKVIGVARTADGSGNLLTSTGNALDVNLKTSAASNLSMNIAQVAGGTAITGGVTGSLGTGGNVAHGSSNSGNPDYFGGEAIAHGTNPTAVSAAQRTKGYFNRAGIPFVIGGHPNIVTIEAAYTAAQTDTAIVTVASGLIIVVTRVSFVVANSTTVDTSVRVGFGTVNTPTTTGVVLTHPGVAAGSGVVEGNGSGMLGFGADGADLRITCSVPTSGSCRVLVSYFTIES